MEVGPAERFLGLSLQRTAGGGVDVDATLSVHDGGINRRDAVRTDYNACARPFPAT
jgi:hypothetical protein